MRKILKGAVVMLIAVALVFTSVAVTAKTQEETNMVPTHIMNPNPAPSSIKQTVAPGAVIFSQLPFQPDESWIFYTSDAGAGYLCQDNYEVNVDICDIHWWGLSLVYPWAPCDPTGMVFEIIFWDQNGAPVCVYQVSPPAVPTGLFYSGFEMYYWEVDLDPCCPLRSGWVSIQSIQSPNDCWFLWAGSDDGDLFAYQNDDPVDTDLAFELTDGGVEPIPAICCDPVGLYFGEELEPGVTYTAQIYVCNCGEPGSLLDWYLDTVNVPAWGVWTFIPAAGTGLAEGACDIVDVTVTVATAGTYSGDIFVYNADDPTDFCKLATGGTWPRAVQNNFFQYILQQFPILNLLFKNLF
jgi:hypothetical protein